MFEKGDIVRVLPGYPGAGIDHVVESCDEKEYTITTDKGIVLSDMDVEQMPELIFEKTRPEATIPTYGSDDAADFDLYTPESFTIPARGKARIKLGIKVQIPPGFTLKFESRSGLSWNNSIEVGAGRIDWKYGKELGLILYNHSDEPYMAVAGDRVAQAIMTRYERARIKEGVVTDRNRDGFGSTGK